MSVFLSTQKHSDDKTSSRRESKWGPESASPSVDLTKSNIFLTSRSIDVIDIFVTF